MMFLMLDDYVLDDGVVGIWILVNIFGSVLISFSISGFVPIICNLLL